MQKKLYSEYEFTGVKPLAREKLEEFSKKDFGYIMIVYIATISFIANIGIILYW
jgi:hypothetical protein